MESTGSVIPLESLKSRRASTPLAHPYLVRRITADDAEQHLIVSASSRAAALRMAREHLVSGGFPAAGLEHNSGQTWRIDSLTTYGDHPGVIAAVAVERIIR
jgi:hypothetical protein